MKRSAVYYILSLVLVFACGILAAGLFGHPNPGFAGERGFGPGPENGRFESACGRRGPGFGSIEAELRHIDNMKEFLGLSDKQVKQIFDIGTEYRGKYFENRNNRDKMETLRVEQRKAVESVFTKDQLEKGRQREKADSPERGAFGPR